ncbi:MAG: hypothetical protein MJY99_10715 [Fibrobacter sp.]|nr:hypothetical protein [Fibrobacter sp.]
MPALLNLLRAVFGGLVFSKAWTWLKGFFIRRVARKSADRRSIFGRIFDFFESMLSASGMMVIIVEALKKIVGFGAVGGAIASGSANLAQIWNLLSSIVDPQTAILDYLAGAFASLPSISSLVASVDSALAPLTSRAFTPALTLSSVLAYTGVGDAINQILMSCIQNLVFVFSLFVIRWAFSNNFTFTKSVSRKQKGI